MNTIETGPSNNARDSEVWSQSWTHFRVDRRSPRYCHLTFDHPPINTITATTVAELSEQDPSFRRAGEVIALDDALNALALVDPRKARVIELRFFGGLSVEETAVVLTVSPDTCCETEGSHGLGF